MRANDSPWWHTEVVVSAMVTSILLYSALPAPLIVQCAITHTVTSLRPTTASDNEHMSEGENNASAGDGAVVVVVGAGGVTACGLCCCRACWGLLLPLLSLPPPLPPLLPLAFPIATTSAAAIYS